jgi:hypothetical protein
MHMQDDGVELTQALINHGMKTDEPSQLADAFRLGWAQRQSVKVTAWVRITDHGDGSSGATLWPSEELALGVASRDGFDSEFILQSTVESVEFDVTDCEKVL